MSDNRPTKTVAESRTELAQIMTPLEANVLGNVFGGAILAMIDLTASATAQKFSGTVAVTASFDRVDFNEPIDVGNLVTMTGCVTYVGRTSMEISIEVTATDLRSGVTRQSNLARVTMVAMRDGKPTPVPRLICETKDEKVQFLVSQARRERRMVHRSELEQTREKYAAMEESELDALIAQA